MRKKCCSSEILLAFGIILFLAIDLRIYNLNKVYTEYDDIGVLTFHKGNAGTREGNYDYTVLKKTISFSWETLRNLENSYLLPFLDVVFLCLFSRKVELVYPILLLIHQFSFQFFPYRLELNQI